MTIKEKIVKKILELRISTPADLASLKRRFAKKYGKPMPSNVELLKEYHKLLKIRRVKESKRLEELLRIRKVRSLSGVAVVSVLTKPYPCPGRCLYCPTQKGIPKSYLDNEPAVMRAILNNFDPYRQVKMRLKALRFTGHPTDKIELIVIGGTWSYLPKRYQTWFIKRCFDACNNRDDKNLEVAQKLNERAKNRIVGLTLETRPDFITESEIKRMRKLGATRVEIGVQSLYDDVLKINKRGHRVNATIRATQLLKDAGFKVCYHMMPNLPGSNIKKDEKMFQELFSNPDFQPDLLKIYPCVVLKEAKLYKFWQAKKYKPYSNKQLVSLLKAIKKNIPYYCRIQRLIRDIPSLSVIAGSKVSNLRQVITGEMKKDYNPPTASSRSPLGERAPGWKCKCIRCREIREDYNPKEKLFLFRQDYEASGGKEIFLSFESVEADQRRLSTLINAERKLYALLRLRIPSQILGGGKHFLPILKNAAIIREVHTYGQLVPILGKQKIAAQHKGLGKKLIKEAEKITKKEFGLGEIAVISGVGVRDYYRKLGYVLKDGYMVKE
jgi:elongator complex protein 3